MLLPFFCGASQSRIKCVLRRFSVRNQARLARYFAILHLFHSHGQKGHSLANGAWYEGHDGTAAAFNTDTLKYNTKRAKGRLLF